MRKTALFVLCLIVLSTNVFASIGGTNITPRVAFSSSRDGNLEIYKMNLDGSGQVRLTNNPATDAQPNMAADGRIVFLSERDGNEEIYVMNANGGSQTRITNNPASDSQPVWSPDGTKIAFVSDRAGGLSDVFVMNADGSGVTQLTNSAGFDNDPVFTTDGTKIVFVSSRDGNHEIYIMNADGSNETRLTNNTLFETRPATSRLGKIAFNRMIVQPGGLSVQIVSMTQTGANQVVLTSNGGNSNPSFSANGRKIFFNSSRDLNPEIYTMSASGANQTRLTNNPAEDKEPSAQPVIPPDTFGVYRPSSGQWILNNEDGTGLDINVTFGGQPGDLPVAGDWNSDGRTDIGFFRNGIFHLALLKTALVPGGIAVIALQTFQFGAPGDRPMAGDWNGDGFDDVGVYRPGLIGQMLIRMPNGGNNFATIQFTYGTTEDLPVAGDWNGNGLDTPGIFHPDAFGDSRFLLTDSLGSAIDHDLGIGDFDLLPLAGDWLGTGKDGIGLFVPSGRVFGLLPDVDNPKVILTFQFGQAGDLPVAGNWTP